MIIFKHAAALAGYIEQQRAHQRKTGFVPTMGALHQGHLALVQQSLQKTGCTVCSIFVNPTQFNNAGDFEKYPNTLEKDILMLEATGTTVLYLPTVHEMYPGGTKHLEQYDLGYLETILEGRYRPGHFQGVCQAMSRLLHAVRPDLLFMGQKDYQQCMVIKQLLQLMRSNTLLVTCPTVREPDGLAMSSRNMRLPAEDREKAVTIFQCLEYIKQHIGSDDWNTLQQEINTRLTSKGFKTDYIELAEAGTLKLVNNADGNKPLVALIAAFLQEVRLIDNMMIEQ